MLSVLFLLNVTHYQPCKYENPDKLYSFKSNVNHLSKTNTERMCVCACVTQAKGRAVGQVGRGCVDNTHGLSWDSSILVKSPSGDNSFSMVFYHSLISTSNDVERDTTHGVVSNEHHSFIPVLDSSGFFKRRESPWCFNDPPFTRHMASPPN